MCIYTYMYTRNEVNTQMELQVESILPDGEVEQSKAPSHRKYIKNRQIVVVLH